MPNNIIFKEKQDGEGEVTTIHKTAVREPAPQVYEVHKIEDALRLAAPPLDEVHGRQWFCASSDDATNWKHGIERSLLQAASATG